jgi:hypothetical protein
MHGGNGEHLLAGLVLLARIGDVGSTYLATPNLVLEANPIVRRFRWPFAFLSLLLCVTPYFDIRAGMMFLVVSLLVTSSNLSKAWIMRALGEVGYLQMVERAAGRSTRRSALGFLLASSGTFALTGLVLLAYGDGPSSWAYWFAWGMIVYAIAIAFHSSLFICRLFRTAAPLQDAA